MKTFHHGGRAGDLFYALYTMKALGGGELTLSNFQEENWGTDLMESVIPLAAAQSYVENVKQLVIPEINVEKRRETLYSMSKGYNYDLHAAEDDYNPEAFPEWDGKHFPGNIHIAKRYAVHFGVEWVPNSVWLEAPKVENDVDVVFHAPMRRLVRGHHFWGEVLRSLINVGLKVVIVAGPNDEYEWRNLGLPVCVPTDFLHTAILINSAKCFLGAASSCNVIAEGLGKRRFVEVADGCWNTNPTDVVNHMFGGQIVQEVLEAVKGGA